MLRRAQSVVIHLDVAEEFVVLLLTGRQIERAERDTRVDALGLHALAIQVVVVGDLEVELDRGAVDRVGLDLERLLDGQEIVLLGSVDAGRSPERDDRVRTGSGLQSGH